MQEAGCRRDAPTILKYSGWGQLSGCLRAAQRQQGGLRARTSGDSPAYTLALGKERRSVLAVNPRGQPGLLQGTRNDHGVGRQRRPGSAIYGTAQRLLLDRKSEAGEC